jgi:hypothetical protein
MLGALEHHATKACEKGGRCLTRPETQSAHVTEDARLVGLGCRGELLLERPEHKRTIFKFLGLDCCLQVDIKSGVEKYGEASSQCRRRTLKDRVRVRVVDFW